MDNILYFDDLKCNKQRILSKSPKAMPVMTSQEFGNRGRKEVLMTLYKRLNLTLWKTFVSCLSF